MLGTKFLRVLFLIAALVGIIFSNTYWRLGFYLFCPLLSYFVWGSRNELAARFVND